MVSELAKPGFAKLNAPPSAAVKHDALVSLGRHFRMFTDRRLTEGSIEHQVSLMTRAERLAKAEELIEYGKQFLPLLKQTQAELDTDSNASSSETSSNGSIRIREPGGAGRASLSSVLEPPPAYWAQPGDVWVPATVQWGAKLSERPASFRRELCSRSGQHAAGHCWRWRWRRA